MREEWEKEPLKGPESSTTVMIVSRLNSGDWLAVVYDEQLLASKDHCCGQIIKIPEWSSCIPIHNSKGST